MISEESINITNLERKHMLSIYICKCVCIFNMLKCSAIPTQIWRRRDEAVEIISKLIFLPYTASSCETLLCVEVGSRRVSVGGESQLRTGMGSQVRKGLNRGLKVHLAAEHKTSSI